MVGTGEKYICIDPGNLEGVIVEVDTHFWFKGLIYYVCTVINTKRSVSDLWIGEQLSLSREDIETDWEPTI